MFYITTPIYYINDEPHIGHAYTTVLADVLARYHRLRGEEVFFLTGVDEHGQKVVNVLKKRGIENPTRADLQSYVDELAARFQVVWKQLNIQYDEFFRTTSERHARVVQQTLQQLWDEGQIYRGEYEGWYCVPDERFWTEKDLKISDTGEPVCPDCGRQVERIVEANYFFRMSAYQDWLVENLEGHPDFIQPSFRRNEVLGFLRKPLSDLCISRPAARLNWGIPLPFDPDYVTYVWFDALLNYATAAGYRSDPARFEHQWPPAAHLIAKDILTTHSVYWPTMLKAAGLPLPRTLFCHGWWTVNGQKMSKSLGNVVRPLDVAQRYGADAFRYLILREMTPGQDGDYDAGRIAARYTSDLANNLGNLLQRVTNMTARYCDGAAPAPVAGCAGPEEDSLRSLVESLTGQVYEQIEQFTVQTALAQCLDTLSTVNAYLERSAPWRRAKEGNRDRVSTILYTAGEALRLVSVLLSPVLPGRTAELWKRIGWAPGENLVEGLAWGGWKEGSQVSVGEPLFPKMEPWDSLPGTA